jgi:hypothetical protein
MSRLVDQSPSIYCSVVSTVPRMANEQTGQPVLEYILLGGRYSPQDGEWADWSTSPRVCHARWSVQSTELSNEQTGGPVLEYVMLGGRFSQ